MADTKISQLPAATTPLAGTESIPVVQGGQTRQVPASAFGGATLHPGYSNQRVYAGNWGTMTTGQMMSGNIFLAHPIIIASTTSIKRLSININGANSPATGYVAIYASSNGVPTTRLVVSPALSVATTGMKSFQLATPLTLAPGAYWGATLFSSSGGGATSYTGSPGFPQWGVGGSSIDWLTSPLNGVMANISYSGGMPATAPVTSSYGGGSIAAVQFEVV